MRALLSVTDKTKIDWFAKQLVDAGYELISTGGTAQLLRNAGIPVREVSDVTKFAEMLDGRVKTLHPAIHGGILGDVRLDSHRQQMTEAGIDAIDIVCVNLYAFEQTVRGEHSHEEAVESIDIGGPAMIRAAAKNFANVTVVVDPNDYETVLVGASRPNFRGELAAKAFRHTAFYDSMIARYLSGQESLTECLTLGYRRTLNLRYGENPHQAGCLYRDPLAREGFAQARQISGKELSYNNILDGDAAWELVGDLPANACAIIKHGNPCGVAALGSFAESYGSARSSDPISAFGGIAAFNGAIDLRTAEAMTEKGNFLEVVIGTSFTQEAVDLIQARSGWGQNVRLLEAVLPTQERNLTVRSVRGGVLIQESDEEPQPHFQPVTKRTPTTEEAKAIEFAWKIVPHVKSNAIVVAGGDRMLGAGAGQMNRVQSVRLALEQAGTAAKGAALASDAFFPFPDSVVTAGEAGITAIVQPGGSKKDDDVIAMANQLGIAMVFTGTRHFRH